MYLSILPEKDFPLRLGLPCQLLYNGTFHLCSPQGDIVPPPEFLDCKSSKVYCNYTLNVHKHTKPYNYAYV